MAGLFQGRTIAVVQDLSADEQLYLYRKTRELKEAILSKRDLSSFRMSDANIGGYLVFMEDSTRTKESFRNAMLFHRIKAIDFDTKGSSFNKLESITDTIKMLFGYGDNRLFVIRSKLEGVCRWLELALGDYARSIGREAPSFINAGDGRHEHPTQEFLDEFGFLEQKKWDGSRIHLALVGDLFHGRTVHSKADGLKVFREVEVDLVAPSELTLPTQYEERMRAAGYAVRRFESIQEYLSQAKVAPIWYFTRLQLERMGDTVLTKAERLRDSVTFRKEDMDRLPEGTRFYHPLPRNREHPTIPTFLDATPLNGWDRQSINGYYTRIVEIGMLAGHFGADFEGKPKAAVEYSDDFVEEDNTRGAMRRDEHKIGIKPVDSGIVIDHIGKGESVETIWNHIEKVRKNLRLNHPSSHGVFVSELTGKTKGIISLPDVVSFGERDLKMLAALAPDCTLNIIQDRAVVKKYRLRIPPRIYNFAELSCKNENCISHPTQCQGVTTEFIRSGEREFVCRYCEKPHSFKEIWDL